MGRLGFYLSEISDYFIILTALSIYATWLYLGLDYVGLTGVRY